MSDHTRPQMKRKFVITYHSKKGRSIYFESSTNLRELLKEYGSVYSGPGKNQYIFHVSRLFDFYEILDYLRTRQLLLNGISEYEDMSEDGLVKVIVEYVLGPQNEPGPENSEDYSIYREFDVNDFILDHILGRQHEPGPEPPLEEWERGTDWDDELMDELEREGWGEEAYTEPEPEEEKEFDFIKFIDAALAHIEASDKAEEHQEPVFQYPDEEDTGSYMDDPEKEFDEKAFDDWFKGKDLDPVDKMLVLLYIL